MPRTCASCNAENPDQAAFCASCGTPLAPHTAAAPPPPTQTPPTQPTVAAPTAASYGPPSAPTPPTAATPWPPTGPPPTWSQQPAGAAGGWPPVQPGPPGEHHRLSPVAIGGVVGVAVVVAVVLGLLLPKAFKSSSTSANTAGKLTTSGGTTPTTGPLFLGPGGSTTTPPSSPTTLPPSPTTTPPTPPPSGGQTFSNQVVSVSAPSGWSKDSQSSSDDLFLDGPNAFDFELASVPVQSGTTIAQIFQNQLAARQQNSPDAKTCDQPQQESVPGNGPSGEAVAVCFTVTPQNGQALPYEDLEYLGLANNASGSGEQTFEVDVYFPQNTAEQTLLNTFKPLMQTIHWTQLRGGGGGGNGGSGNGGTGNTGTGNTGSGNTGSGNTGSGGTGTGNTG